MIQFGYLPQIIDQGEQQIVSEMRTEKMISDALAELQRIARIPVTGRLDNETLNVLERPRCGLKDTEIIRKQSLINRFKRNNQSLRQILIFFSFLI